MPLDSYERQLRRVVDITRYASADDMIRALLLMRCRRRHVVMPAMASAHMRYAMAAVVSGVATMLPLAVEQELSHTNTEAYAYALATGDAAKAMLRRFADTLLIGRYYFFAGAAALPCFHFFFMPMLLLYLMPRHTLRYATPPLLKISIRRC